MFGFPFYSHRRRKAGPFPFLFFSLPKPPLFFAFKLFIREIQKLDRCNLWKNYFQPNNSNEFLQSFSRDRSCLLLSFIRFWRGREHRSPLLEGIHIIMRLLLSIKKGRVNLPRTRSGLGRRRFREQPFLSVPSVFVPEERQERNVPRQQSKTKY